MKTLPKEFILTDFTKEEGNEVLGHHFDGKSLTSNWDLIVILENVYDYAKFENYIPAYISLPRISYQQWKEIVSSKKKFNFTNSREDIFYKIIYPIFPKEFLFGNNLEKFLQLVNETFSLNDVQLEIIVEHWKNKENILV